MEVGYGRRKGLKSEIFFSLNRTFSFTRFLTKSWVRICVKLDLSKCVGRKWTKGRGGKSFGASWICRAWSYMFYLVVYRVELVCVERNQVTCLGSVMCGLWKNFKDVESWTFFVQGHQGQWMMLVRRVWSCKRGMTLTCFAYNLYICIFLDKCKWRPNGG